MPINLNIDRQWKKTFARGYDTPRLHIRVLGPEDTPDLFDLLLENNLYRFVPEIENGLDARKWLEQVHDKSGFQFLMIRDSETSEPVGFLMINRETRRQVTLGGCIAVNLWNRGYATEVLTGLITHLSAVRFPDPVIVRIHPENFAVRTVLLKSGFLESGPVDASDGMITLTLP
jgi:RimJ/RimL family protein N-acetyltransferase